ncbi:hypothetical protein GCM10009736_08920 [Actinomadura bangladeshensis]
MGCWQAVAAATEQIGIGTAATNHNTAIHVGVARQKDSPGGAHSGRSGRHAITAAIDGARARGPARSSGRCENARHGVWACVGRQVVPEEAAAVVAEPVAWTTAP